jgi:hypothetical protein
VRGERGLAGSSAAEAARVGERGEESELRGVGVPLDGATSREDRGVPASAERCASRWASEERGILRADEEANPRVVGALVLRMGGAEGRWLACGAVGA